MKKVLVIAPHADDEALGVGGYLIHQAANGAEIHIAFGTIGGNNPKQIFEHRIAEFESVKKLLHVTASYIICKNMDAMLDTLPALTIASQIDQILDEVQPDEVFVNYSSHHQDHKKIYECSLIAFRLKAGYNPKLIALYEYPFVGNHYDDINGGSWYHDISDVIDQKVALCYCYKSQLSQRPSPLNEDGIRALALIRGLECGAQYAEKFYILRLVK